MRKDLLSALGTIAVLVVLGVSAVVVVQLLRSDDTRLLREAPRVGSDASPVPPGDPEERLHFVVDSTASSAKYVVREKLAALPVSTNAVGQTSAVTGDLYLTTQDLAVAPDSLYRVDLRTLRSDEAMRDNFIRGATLATGQFPFAEFRVKQVTGFPASYVEGTEIELSLSGDMNIHGVTRAVTFSVKARKTGSTLTAVADTDFKMTDFGIRPPDLAVSKAEDSVHVQVVLVATLQRDVDDQ